MAEQTPVATSAPASTAPVAEEVEALRQLGADFGVWHGKTKISPAQFLEAWYGEKQGVAKMLRLIKRCRVETEEFKGYEWGGKRTKNKKELFNTKDKEGILINTMTLASLDRIVWVDQFVRGASSPAEANELYGEGNWVEDSGKWQAITRRDDGYETITRIISAGRTANDIFWEKSPQGQREAVLFDAWDAMYKKDITCVNLLNKINQWLTSKGHIELDKKFTKEAQKITRWHANGMRPKTRDERKDQREIDRLEEELERPVARFLDAVIAEQDNNYEAMRETANRLAGVIDKLGKRLKWTDEEIESVILGRGDIPVSKRPRKGTDPPATPNTPNN